MSLTAVHPTDLEPSLVAARTYATRRRRLRIDSAAIISLMIFLLYAIPASLIVPELTFAGRPALLLALGMFAWWLMARLNPWLLLVGPQPLRWISLVYLLSILLPYVAGLLRGLPTLEANRQDFTVLVTFEFIGLVLIAADGIPNWNRLYGVLRVFVGAAAFMGGMGMIQSITKIDVTQYLVVPGMQVITEFADFQGRGDSGLFRVASTATHYIEFSTLMAVAVPYAIHLARFAATRNARIMWGFLAMMMAAVIPMAISRTGALALVTAAAVMFFTVWNWRLRYTMMALGAVVIGGLVVAKPGLLGTLRAMFLSVDEDPSITGRTDDYAHVGAWFAQRPWLGRGPGTLIPDIYLILDNQWLLTLVTGGIIGVVGLATLHIGCISLAAIAMRRSTRPQDRDLCAALISTQVVAILVGATFDSLSFTTYAFTLALCCGLAGTVWRFTHPTAQVRTSAVSRQ